MQRRVRRPVPLVDRRRASSSPGARLELERPDRFLALLDGRRARDDDGVVGAVAAPGQRELGGRQAPRLGEFDVFPRRRRAARRAVPRLELGLEVVPRELEGPVAGVPCVLVLARQRPAPERAVGHAHDAQVVARFARRLGSVWKSNVTARSLDGVAMPVPHRSTRMTRRTRLISTQRKDP